MAEQTISTIKCQTQLVEQLLEYHFKMEAQIDIILKVDLQDCDAFQLHNYFCGLNDLVCQARRLNEELLNFLMRESAREHSKTEWNLES